MTDFRKVVGIDILLDLYFKRGKTIGRRRETKGIERERERSMQEIALEKKIAFGVLCRHSRKVNEFEFLLLFF
jgi:hypothetical protein